MKRLIVSIAATLALAAVAMPTNDEVKKAVPTVKELMNPLVAEFRARKKSAVEVGETAMAYAKEADTEAAKFLLLKGAVWYFAQAKDDAKAVAAIIALGEQVKDLPPEVLRNDILKPAIDHVSEQNVPGLFAQFRSASAQMEIAKLASSIKRNRADEPTRRRYAELLVVTGDWKAALEVFAKLDDAKTAKAAKEEIGGTTLATAGDFWWNYTPTEPTAADAIKAHAVALYRKAIASGELTGLKKVVAEKRIASTPFADSFNVSDDGGAGRAANVSAAPRGGVPSNALYCVIDLSAGPNASKYPVSYLAAEPKGGWTDEYKTTKLVLRRIEPGKFMMTSKKLSVTLSKPYYMGIFEMTQKQYELVTGKNPSKYKGEMRPVATVHWNEIRGDSSVHDWPTVKTVDQDSFVGRLRARTDLSFDLPTEAQWEYACRAGTTSNYNNGSNYSKKSNDGRLNLGRFFDNCSDGRGGYAQHTTVGSYIPDAWGLYDMHGNVGEWCLDWWTGGIFLQDGVVDPVGPSASRDERKLVEKWGVPSGFRVVRSAPWFSNDPYIAFSSGRYPALVKGNHPSTFKREDGIGFRLCMNPDGPVGTSARGSGTPAASAKEPSNALYCVIDLSAGPDAGKYPVSYLAAEPKGGWTDEYKTTKLVLRRIEPGTFKMGFDNPSLNAVKLDVTLTKPFYCGIFEVTQKQYEQIMGDNPAEHRGDMRPVEKVSWNMVRGDSSTHAWPTVRTAASDSLVGRLGARTGLSFDLPTEAQWEYACRAGTVSSFNNGGNSLEARKKVGRFKDNQSDGKGGYHHTTTVGSYQPNAWGLYDMHGNVQEWCLNWFTAREFMQGGVDPEGPAQSRDERQLVKHGARAGDRVCRGGTYLAEAPYEGTSYWRLHYDPSKVSANIGFRLCMNPSRQK